MQGPKFRPAPRPLRRGREADRGRNRSVTSYWRQTVRSCPVKSPIRHDSGLAEFPGVAGLPPTLTPPHKGGRGPEKTLRRASGGSLPHKGGRDQKRAPGTLASGSLPPCGGGLGWGETPRHRKSRAYPARITRQRPRLILGSQDDKSSTTREDQLRLVAGGGVAGSRAGGPEAAAARAGGGAAGGPEVGLGGGDAEAARGRRHPRPVLE